MIILDGSKPFYYYSCVVNKVIDGDTLDITFDLGFRVKVKDRVRLLAVSAPEIKGQDKDKGLIAKKYLLNLIDTKGPDFLAKTYPDERLQDKYGRWLVTLFTKSGEDINFMIIKSNYGLDEIEM